MTTQQAPIGSGFNAKSSAREVLGSRKLDGVTAIVTGGYAGIGLETTRVLSDAGATVIVPARTVDKARSALEGIARVEVEAMDLADPASIDAFSSRFIASARPLQLLINNAGIMAGPLVRDARKYEMQFATNHLGHFQLTSRLWPALKKANGARVVELTSRGHHRSGVDFEDLNFDRRAYDPWLAYGQSKTANVLFAIALDARAQSHGVRAFAVHPGGIITELMRSMPKEEVTAILANPRNAPDKLKSVEQGAATTMWCATSAKLAGMGGVYCEDCDIAVPLAADAEGEAGVKPWATDPKLADRLWTNSEELTGVRFVI